MFSNCNYSKDLIVDLQGMHTPKLTEMSNMFGNSTLKEIRLSNLNTSKVQNMNNMFYRTKTKKIELSTLDVHNVTTMVSMFERAEAKIIDFSNLTVKCQKRQYINAERMFSECKAEILNINNLDLSRLKNIDNMFDFCEIGRIIFHEKEYTTKEMQEIIKNYDGHRDYKRHNK